MEIINQKTITRRNLKKNNLMVVFNVLYTKKEKIHPTYVSKHNSKLEKPIILSTFSNEVVWHYIRVTKLSENNKLELHKKVCENKNFCDVIIPSKDTNILELIQTIVPATIYANLKCLVKKMMNIKIIHLQQK